MGVKSNCGGVPQRADLHVVGFTLADGHAVVGQVGDADEDVAQTRVGFFGTLFSYRYLFAQLLGLVDLRSRVLLVLLELSNLFAGRVAPGLEGLGFSDCSTALLIDGVEILEDRLRVHATLPEFLFNQGEMIAYECQVEHKNPE